VRAQVQWTTAAERTLIVEEALGLLERVGMKFGPCDALDTLAEAGAAVDREKGVARIPADLVRATVATCSRRVVLGGLTPEDDCVLDEGASHFSNSGAPPKTLDMDSGERRSSTTRDLTDATRVLDAIESTDIVWPIVAATDQPDDRRMMAELAVCLANTRKHVQHEAEGRWQVEPMLRMAEATGGDLHERPRVSLVCCTASPLLAHGELLDASTELAAHGIPVVIYPMPIAGGTAPITVAGTVTMNIAEFLGAATAMLLRAPQAPIIMGAGVSLLDMRQTTYSLGALETGLMAAACVEIGHELGVPCLAPALASDAKHPGIQAAFEKALKGMTVASTAPDLMTGGIGVLDGAGLMSLPQIVIDDEVARMIALILKGAEVDREAIMPEIIDRVGHTGNYLVEKETRRRLRAGELFMPAIADRQSYEHWAAAGVDELAVAEEKVRQILAAAAAAGPLLDEDRLRELDESVEAAAAAVPH
jgi:trimethylamine--corrinoid protein Co-methyltransferase